MKTIQPEPKKIGNDWTFLNNHTHVLLCLAREPGARLRDVAVLVGITERAVQKIVRDLEESSVLRRFRDGRRNQYEIDFSQPLRHPLESNHTVGELLGLFLSKESLSALMFQSSEEPRPGNSSLSGSRIRH